jgi:hypothetical protein
MAGRPKREIRDQDVQGLKCLRKVGAERDRAGNRRLFMDRYCALSLMSLLRQVRALERDQHQGQCLGGAARAPRAGVAGKRSHGWRSAARSE